MVSKRCAIALLACAMLAGQESRASDISRQIQEGRGHYVETCVVCHGEDGKRGEGFQTPIWGQGSFIAAKFGNAQALIDYMQLMPFNDPSLLDETQKIAVVAFILSNHGTIKPTETLDPAKANGIAIR